MDDDDQDFLEEEANEIELAEYRRGLALSGGSTEEFIKECPWCNEYSYEFSILCGWDCRKCGYYPGADLFGGKFS